MGTPLFVPDKEVGSLMQPLIGEDKVHMRILMIAIIEITFIQLSLWQYHKFCFMGDISVIQSSSSLSVNRIQYCLVTPLFLYFFNGLPKH